MKRPLHVALRVIIMCEVAVFCSSAVVAWYIYILIMYVELPMCMLFDASCVTHLLYQKSNPKERWILHKRCLLLILCPWKSVRNTRQCTGTGTQQFRAIGTHKFAAIGTQQFTATLSVPDILNLCVPAIYSCWYLDSLQLLIPNSLQHSTIQYISTVLLLKHKLKGNSVLCQVNTHSYMYSYKFQWCPYHSH